MKHVAEMKKLKPSPKSSLLNTFARESSSGSYCISGSISVEAAVDVRVGMKFSALRPIELAREACEESAIMLQNAMSPLYNMAKTAVCFDNTIGVDISKVTNKEESFDAFTSAICGKAVDFLVPNELEKFACTVSTVMNPITGWATITSQKPTLNVGLCLGTGTSHSTELKIEGGAKSLSCPSS